MTDDPRKAKSRLSVVNWLPREEQPRPRDWVQNQWPSFQIVSVENTALRLVREQDELESAIQRSVCILELAEDWDGDGAKPIDPKTWKVATELAQRLARSYEATHRLPLPAPAIGPCPDGSIDLHWRTSGCHVLINVQETGTCDFYGEAGTGHVKGVFAVNDESMALALTICVGAIRK